MSGRVPETRQQRLDLDVASPTLDAEASQGQAWIGRRFQEDRPENLFVGEVRLEQYLRDNDMGWVIQLRRFVEEADYEEFIKHYDGRGRNPIHPRVIIGLALYGILRRQWSLRELEGLAIRDLGAWWICGGLRPDHSTIGKFIQLHSDCLTEGFFLDLTQRLVQRLGGGGGMVAGDGTVIKAAGSRFRKLKREAAAEEAARLAKEEPDNPRGEQLSAAVTQADQRAARRKEKGQDPDTVVIAETEPEAVFQKLKDVRVAPSYKPSVFADERGLIVGQRLEQTSETAAVKPLLEQYENIHGGALPERVLLDAGYHANDILALFVGLDLDLLCPSGAVEKKGSFTKQGPKGKYGKHDFRYDDKSDIFYCPAGERLDYCDRGRDTYGRRYRRYRCASCADCELRSRCTQDKAGRTVRRYEGDELKEAMAEVFDQRSARQAYRRRQATVEPVFSRLRYGQGLTRFHRRGQRGAAVEFSLHCLAHNLRKGTRLLGTLYAGVIIAKSGPQAPRYAYFCLLIAH